MSINCSTYVGPYFRCIPQKGEVEKTVRTCPNPDCREHRRELWDRDKIFCERCASEITEVTYTTEGLLQCASEIAYEDLKEQLMVALGKIKNFHMFIPNVVRNNPRQMYVSNKNEVFCVDIDSETIEKEKKWLEDNFIEEYLFLLQKYSAENTKICWGTICWMS